MSKTVRAIIILWLGALTLFSVYGGAWFWMKDRVMTQIENAFADAASQGVLISGAKPEIYGFPGPYKVMFSGSAVYRGTELVIPQLVVRSFFLPGGTVRLELPHGAQLSGAAKDVSGYDPELNSVDSLFATGLIPESFPERWDEKHLSAWKENGGAITIEKFSLRKQGLHAQGSGTFNLDDDLQPAGQAQVKLTGALDFLSWLKSKKIVDDKYAIITGTVLSGLAQDNPETGEKEIDIALSLQNRMLFLGPLRVGYLPEFRWDTHNPPAPLQ